MKKNKKYNYQAQATEIFEELHKIKNEIIGKYQEVLSFGDVTPNQIKEFMDEYIRDIETYAGYSKKLADLICKKTKTIKTIMYLSLFVIIVACIMFFKVPLIAILIMVLSSIVYLKNLDDSSEWVAKADSAIEQYDTIEKMHNKIVAIVNQRITSVKNELDAIDSKQVEFVEPTVCFERKDEILIEEIPEVISENLANLPENVVKLARIKPQNDKKPKKS